MPSRDPLERLANVIVNLGLSDRFKASDLTHKDMLTIIDCIRDGDEYAVAHGQLPFPWTDEEIVNRLALASKMHAEVRV